MKDLKLLSLGLLGTTDELRYKMQQDCVALAQKGFHLAIDEINKGNLTFIGCNIIEDELSFHNYERYKSVIVNYVAKMLTDVIILREEKNIVRKIIAQNYYYFNEAEQNIIYENTLKMLNNTGSVQPDFSFSHRRNHIFTKLMTYLNHHHELVLDGFLNFRLKEYRKQLSEIVDQVVDEYMMDLEFKEFIRILCYFVDVQEPKVDEVHVIISDGGTFKIMDADGGPVSENLLGQLLTDHIDTVNYEDVLISSLITIAPQTITIHNADSLQENNIIDTIKMIFSGRVIMCPGCPICKKS